MSSHRQWLISAYSVIGEVEEGSYDRNNTSVLVICRLDALKGVGWIAFQAQVKAWSGRTRLVTYSKKYCRCFEQHACLIFEQLTACVYDIGQRLLLTVAKSKYVRPGGKRGLSLGFLFYKRRPVDQIIVLPARGFLAG